MTITTNRLRNLMCCAVCAGAFQLLCLSAFAQGTAFTYQGRLLDAGAPANGNYDLRFALFDSASGGTQQGGFLTNSATTVSNGLFTVLLDFGSQFPGAARWLETAVRTNGAGTFFTLNPRQALTPAPYAVTAGALLSGGLAAGTYSNALSLNNPANQFTGAFSGDGGNLTNLNAASLNDGGAAAYQSVQQTLQAAGACSALPFSALLPVSATNGVPPALSLALNGAPFGSVVGFSGNEGISQPYAYVVEVLFSGTAVDPNSELGLPGVLSFTRNGRTTTFSGTVTACTLAGSTGAGLLYTVRLEPPLASLALSTNYRVYQFKTASQIASQACSNDGLTAPSLSLSGTYTTHAMVIQYAETDLNFFSRVLENEGIFYLFNQSASPPSLVLGDSTSAYLASASSLPYYGNLATNLPPGLEYVRTFQKAVHPSTLTSTVDAYSFLNPSTSLAESASGSAGTGENYEFGNDVATTGYNTQLAQAREAVQTWQRATIAGSSVAPDLRAGYTFSLNDQSAAGLGGSYLVTSVRHSGFLRVTNGVSVVFYGNTFEAIPAALKYCPPRVTPKPQARPCTATVTAPAGTEIYTDKYGRVKVLFHWDRYGANNDTSSAWLRVASPWAGQGFGALFVPRAGEEVLVSFLEGDPDQPVVLGSLYNNQNLPPYTLPASKTVSGIKTWSSPGGTNGNELRFDDKLGSELLYLNATKDLSLNANNNLLLSAAGQITMNGALTLNGSQTVSGSVSAGAVSVTGPENVGSLSVGGTASFSGSVSGGFNSPLVLMQNNNISGSTAPTLRMIGNGSSPSGVLSVSSQGTGLIAQFGNASSFVADITTNGTFDAAGFNGGTLRVGTGGTTFFTIQSGQAIMPPSTLAATNFTITFPQAFTSVPKVIATVSGDPAFPSVGDTFALSVRALTSTTGFTVNVVRVDAATGWSQQLRINWQAWQ